MAGTLKPGTKDICAICDVPLVYDRLEFWKDTEELVPQGPPYPTGGLMTEPSKAKAEAYDNWIRYRQTRGTVNPLGYPVRRDFWVHILSWPIEKKSDISFKCPSKVNMNARPSGWCMETLNVGGDCKRRAKEVVDTGYGGKKALCGIHLGHLRKAQKIAEERANALSEEEWRSEEIEKRIEELKKFGIDADKHWLRNYNGSGGHYTGLVVINPDKLLAVLRESIEVFDA